MKTEILSIIGLVVVIMAVTFAAVVVVAEWITTASDPIYSITVQNQNGPTPTMISYHDTKPPVVKDGCLHTNMGILCGNFILYYEEKE